MVYLHFSNLCQTLCLLGNLHAFLSSAVFFFFFFFFVCVFFFKSTFLKNYFRNIIRVSNSLDPDQGLGQNSLDPDQGLGPNCLQRLHYCSR